MTKTTKTEYKIRPLTRGDRVVLSKMIERVAGQVSGDMLGLIVTASDTSNPNSQDAAAARSRLGIEIIKLLMGVLNNELTDWFASLFGVTVEEFDKMPFDIEVEIVKQLQEAEEVTGFFSGAFQQFNGILASKAISKARKTK